MCLLSNMAAAHPMWLLSPSATDELDFLKKLINFCLCWVFVSVQGLSLVVASGGHSSSRCAGLSLSLPLLLRSTSSRRAGSVVAAHGPSCSAACGIFPDQGSNPCPLHWQADSQPLRHLGSPHSWAFDGKYLTEILVKQCFKLPMCHQLSLLTEPCGRS